MGIVGKTAWMAAGSLALLIALGHADPSNKRLMSSLFSNEAVGVLPKGSFDEEAIGRAIVQFNRDLSTAYLQLDAAALAANPMADALKRNYEQEIAFLKQDGRVLQMTVEEVQIRSVARLANERWSVDTVESVQIGYLNASDRSPRSAPAAARYAMNYTLDRSGSGWAIVGVETMKADRRDE